MIRLDYRDARPIYEQVKDGLRRLMVTGVLAPGEKLPSVRSLAMDLAINPNTIQPLFSQKNPPGSENKSQIQRESVVLYFTSFDRKISTFRPCQVLQELRELGMTEGEWIALWRGGNENA